MIENLEGRQLLAADLVIDNANALSMALASLNQSVTVSFNGATNTYTINDNADVINITNNGSAIVSGSGTNTVTVSGIGSLAFTATGGTDNFNINSVSHPTTITNSSNSNNTVTLGAGGSVGGLIGSVDLIRSNGKTNLRVIGNADTTAHAATLSNSGLSGVTAGGITFDAAQLLAGTILLGDGAQTFNIATTTLGGPVSVASGSADDSFVFADGASLAGGAVDAEGGTNTLDYSAYSTAVSVNLASGTATGTGGITGFSIVKGGSAGDILVGSNTTFSQLFGGPGADTLTAGSAGAKLIGDTGNDTLNGGAGTNTFIWNNGDNSDTINGGAGANIVQVNGSSAGDDVFNVVGSGGRTLFSRTSLVPFTLDIGGMTRLEVSGLGGNDSLSLDLSNGNIIPVNGVNFDGGTGNNSLSLKGGSFNNEIYAATGPGVGTLTFDSTSVVTFSNLKPVFDTVPVTNFSMSTPGVVNSLQIIDGPTVNTFRTTQVGSALASPTFELINFANKVNANIVDNGPGDSVLVNNPNGGAGLSTLQLTTSALNDSLKVVAAPAGVVTSIDLGAGDDAASVAAASLPASPGSLSITGGGGVNKLTLNAAGTTTPPVLGNGTITFGNQTLNYSEFDNVTIYNAVSVAPVFQAPVPITGTAGVNLNGVTVGIFSDSDGSLKNVDFGVTINWGDGTSTAGIVRQDASNPTLFYISGNHTYKANGTFNATVSVHDFGGTSTTLVNGVPVTVISTNGQTVPQNTTATIADAPITAQGAPIAATENQAFTGVTVATFSSSNPSATAGQFSAVIDWGDNSNSAGTITQVGVTPNGIVFNVAGGHTYLAEGTYAVKVTITSTAGSAAVATSSAVVADGAISVIGVAVTGTAGTPIVPTTAVAQFSDAGGLEPAGTYTATVNWGDGTASAVPVVSITGGTASILSGHTFANPGTYTGSVTVKSAGGSLNTASFTINVSGLAATDLPVTSTEDVPLNNVALINLTSVFGPAPVASNYAATIDWGDATAPTPGAIDSSLNVLGNHTYDEAGVYNVKITISTVGTPNLLTYTRTLTVQDVPIILTGTLDAKSDSGISNSDWITNVVQPSFHGTSEPLSTVRVTAVPVGGGNPIDLGTATTDTSGAWSIKSGVALADGVYTINSSAIDRNNATTAAVTLGTLTIDTLGPKVSNLVFNRMKGQLDVTLVDELSGLAQRTIVDNANYAVTKPHNRPGRLLFTSLSATAAAVPTDPQTVTGLINNGYPIKGSTFTFTVGSGITDVAGNGLDGSYYGYFNSGHQVNPTQSNSQAASDFVAIVDTFHGLVFPAKPSQGYASPNNPPGTLATGYTISNRNLNPDSSVTNLFPGQYPGQRVVPTVKHKAVKKVVTPKVSTPKVTHPTVTHQPGTAYTATLAALANGRRPRV